MPDRNSRLLETDAGNQAMELGCEVGLSSTAGVGGLGHGYPQPGAPLAGPSALAFAGAFPIPRTQAGPTDQVARRREPTQVEPDLRQQHFGCPAVTPGIVSSRAISVSNGRMRSLISWLTRSIRSS